MLPTQKEPNLLLYPSSSQKSSWKSQTGYGPISRKWIIIGFKPVLPYLWSHICDCSKYGTMTQFSPINHKENSPLKLLGNISRFFTSFESCCIRAVLRAAAPFPTMTWQVLSRKGNAARMGEQTSGSLGPGWPCRATEVLGAPLPQASLMWDN